MVSHAQKSHVPPHFDPLDLKNAILLVMLLSTSHAVYTNTVASHGVNTNISDIA